MKQKNISNGTKIVCIWPYQKVHVKSFNLQKESTQTELRNSSYDQTKFEFKSDLIQILNFSKTCLSYYPDRGDHNEDVGVGFFGFGLTSKKLCLFEAQGLFCK